MAIGPILRKELLLASRRRSTYVARVSAATTSLVAVGALVVCAEAYGVWDLATVAGQARFALICFGAVAGVSTLLALMVTPTEVAPRVATERDRKSLDALLTTRLTGTEVVAGNLAAGLLSFASATLAGVPLVVVLAVGGGVDLRLVLLGYAALGATAFAAGSIGVWLSAHARDARRAVGYAILLMMGWAYLPLLASVILPRLWPWGMGWVGPVGWWMIDTSPIGLLAHLTGLKQRGTFVEATLRMIAWELAGGGALLAWTALRFRAICRAVDDREGRRWLRGLRRLATARRPPCGDDPVLWYETYNTRGVGPIMRRFNQGVGAACLLAFAAVIAWFAVPAFAELARLGYGPAARGSGGLELHPFVRALAGFKAAPAAVPPGMARVEFNAVLRTVSALILSLLPLVLAGFAAEGIAGERVRDTLSGLLTTSLTGREILLGKALGVLRRVQFWPILLVVLWTLGLLSGAVHPLGFLAALAGLAVSTWFVLALGTYGSLWADDLKQASHRVTAPTTLVAFGGIVPLIVPRALTSALLGAASPSWHCYLALASYDDVRDALAGLPYAPLAAAGVDSGEGFGMVALTCLLGWGAQAVAAFVLTRASLRGFDAAVGRPVRAARAVETGPGAVLATVGRPAEAA